MIISKKNMTDMQFLLLILIFSLVSFLVLKVREGLCSKATTCNRCKKKSSHWGWLTLN